MLEDLSKRLYVENAEAWKEALIQKRFVDVELEVKVVERGIILPSRKIKFGTFQGGVCDENLNFVAGNKRKYAERGGFNTIESAYEVAREDIIQLDEDVIFGGLLAEHFGHFLTESLCRLWYVIQHPELKSKVLFVTTLKDGDHRKYTNKILELAGVAPERIVYVGKPMQCRSITIPEQAQYDWTRMHKEFLLPYQEIKSHVTPNNRKKLYLTRTGFEFTKKHGNVHCFNEKYFEDFFSARGFEVVSIEKLEAQEQISLIMGADEIAANIGTLTHWALFCKLGAKFIMLNRTSSFVTKIQAVINNVSDADWYIVDGSKNYLFADRTHGVCMFGANKYWKVFVAHYFGERLDENQADKYFNEALPDYINFWLKKYSKSNEQVADSIKNVCSRIAALEREMENNRSLSIIYQTHVALKGWGEWKKENQLSNNLELNLDIQAIRISFTQPFYEIYYSVYYNDKEGWSEEVSRGQMAGTTGKAKAITGVKIWLNEFSAKIFNVFYRVHKFDGEWTSWAKNGEEILSGGIKLNSIQIKLEDRFRMNLPTS